MKSRRKKISPHVPIKRRLGGAVIFILMAIGMACQVPTTEIAWMCSVLLLTIYLFAFEIVEVDVAAVSIMVLLGLTDILAPFMGLEKGLVDPNHLFDGFSGNAVISIIAVMILGAGLDKTGVMNKVATLILRIGGSGGEKRVIPIISTTVACISSFFQNVGAAALFLPVVSRISARSDLAMSRLLMPMGFCAIIGGTVTMIGSSPLIMLNDLIENSNKHLPAETQMEAWSLFAVTPIGLALVTGGVLYFVLAGRFVLPTRREAVSMVDSDATKNFREIYGIDAGEEVKNRSNPKQAATQTAGVVEVVLPRHSDLVGQKATCSDLPNKHGLSLIALHRNGTTIRNTDGALENTAFEEGDSLVVYTTHQALCRAEKNRNVGIIATEFPHEKLRAHKLGEAAFFFGIAFCLAIFTDMRLSIALFTGAIGMIMSGVLRIEEAYQAVSWKTVFLLASLIPLGAAVESTGCARWIADKVIFLSGDWPIWAIQAILAAMTTFFTLVMSNVGATILLVPLAVNIAVGVDANPAVFALTVAIASSNSFLIPTHQVNALIMGPGGYRVPDFMRAGGIMTLLFLVILVSMLQLVF